MIDEELRGLFELAKSYAFEYMDGVCDRAVFPTEDAIERLGVFDEELPEKPSDSSEILHMLHEYGSPATVAQTGGRYFGFVIGGANRAAVAAKWLSAAWDQNSALYVMSPVVSRLEAVCERWLVDLFGLPTGTAAGFVSGTSVGTICGLAAARNEILNRLGWDINLKGLFGAPRIRVVLGDQAHSSVFKALTLLGFGEESLERIPVDGQGRMIAGKLPELDDKTIVIVQAGNVNSGAFDPIDEICDHARKANSWIHVDGAFGLWAAASEGKRSLTKGIERADSWSVDAHKTLNAPFDCGIILCKDREALVTAMQSKGSYIQYSRDDERRDGMLYTPDMSRCARGVELWATLKSLGKSGVERLVDRLCDLAVEFAGKLSGEGFNVLNDVVFNQIIVSCGTDEETKTTLKNIQSSGECWCGGAVWEGRPVVRVSVCSWATTAEDIDRSVAAFVAARDGARSGG
ncbi:MAG: aspartate aminotransferase family protein [Deltaproteobacteria bacterium]|uniref:Aspartate aminotransferase family protein n=1 Tax=Candidatus Zymogenus saltonus TaxID=2844893 RepID=A0A9D8KF33_9DELT|nr:aspartate aminotransferase family protein [Candidatus Zymogenus saltonus]